MKGQPHESAQAKEMKIGAVTFQPAKHQPRKGRKIVAQYVEPAWRSSCATLARKCWVEKNGLTSLRRRLVRSEAERFKKSLLYVPENKL
jgi:hypothetical protein